MCCSAHKPHSIKYSVLYRFTIIPIHLINNVTVKGYHICYAKKLNARSEFSMSILLNNGNVNVPEKSGTKQ